MNNMLTTPQVWSNYDAEKYDLDIKLHQTDGVSKTYTYLAQKTADGEVIVEMSVYSPSFDSNKVVLLVGQYDIPVQKEVIFDLVKRGYVVCVPDYDGVKENTLTVFPLSLEYGYYSKAGDHIKKVCPTALETCQFLYSKIIRRGISFINTCLNKKEIICIGFGEGVEVAMQVAGVDDRLLGLVCVNGASYSEYTHYNKYGSVKEMKIDDELMNWLTGVSSIAYAKHINIPVFFAVGSNGTFSDIDRLANIYNLIPSEDVKLIISPRYINNIDGKAYDTIVSWLENKFVYSTLPELPQVSVSINKEGAVYADINVDNIIKIDSVKVYYSYGDYNHVTRYWEEVAGEATAINNYIAKLEITEPEAPLFVFAEVKYRNNIRLSSIPYYQNLSSHKVKSSREKLNPIVFQYSINEGEFNEVSKNAIVLNSSLKEGVIPIGLKGLVCENGGMVSFAIGTKKNIMDDKLLQIDTYSAKDEYELSVTAITGGEVSNEYTAVRNIEVNGDTFCSERFVFNDFKDKNFMPLEDWSMVKGIRINNANIIVGKIMFV